MNIPGSLPPMGGVNRVANAYGVSPQVAVKKGGSPESGVGDTGAAGLRSVLNDEERAYFDQMAAMGPVTYGPSRKGGVMPEAPKGLRLDVRG